MRFDEIAETPTELTAESFPSIMAILSSTENKYRGTSDLDHFVNSIIPMLNDSLAKEEIFNVDYKEIKDFLNRRFEKAADKKIKQVYLSRYRGEDTMPEGTKEAYYSQWSLHLISGIIKKFNKLNGDLVQEVLKLAAELKPLADAMKILKPFVVKGRKPNPNAKTKVRSTENTGTCGVCGGNYKMRGGKLVDHGYIVPRNWGGRQGHCFGVGYEPFEVSPKACQDYIELIKSEMEKYGKMLKNAQEGKLTKLMAKSDNFRVKELEEITPDDSRWDQQLKIHIGQIEGQLRAMNADLKTFTELVNNWKPGDLPK